MLPNPHWSNHMRLPFTFRGGSGRLGFLAGWFRSPLLVGWIPEPDMRSERDRAIDELLVYLEAM